MLGVMKSSLFLFIVFLILCTALTFFCAFAYVLVDGCTHMAAGTSISFFSVDVFLHGIITCFPFVAGFSCMGVIFYMIRHPSSSIISLVLYSLIGICVWAVLIPQSMKIESMGLFKSSNAKTEVRLTEGYFRPSDYGVYYYSKISAQNIAQGLYIDTSGTGGVKGDVTRFTNLQLAPSGDEFFSDPLFAKSAKITVVLEHIIAFAKTARYEAFKGLKKGYFNYLSFASLGLALLSIIGIKSMSSWKLLNLSFVIILYVGICRLNLLIYTSPVFENVIAYFTSKNIVLLTDKSTIQLFTNCLIAGVFITIGIIQFIIHRSREKRASEV